MPDIGTQGLENLDIIIRVQNARLIKKIAADRKWETKEMMKEFLKSPKLIEIPIKKKSN